LWTPLAFFGFHPHHEGLMLATLNLTSDAIRNGDPLPFNQYGPFWTLPYLSMNLLPIHGYTFLVQRFVSIFLIFLSAIMIRRISLIFYSRNTSLAVACLFLLTYPYGQPSIIWPSIPAQLALLILTFSILRTIESNRTIFISFAGITTLFLLGSRIQIGLVSFLCTIAVFAIHRKSMLLVRYLLFTMLYSALAFAGLHSRGSIKDIIFDSFVFPFTYLDPNQQNWTLPRTSLLIVIVLFALFFVLNRLNESDVAYRILLSILYTVSIGFLFIQFSNETTYLKIYARLYVGLFLSAVAIVLIYLSKDLLHIRNKVSPKTVLYMYSLVGSVQVFPLFDAFHAWYASAPLIIAVPMILKKMTFRLSMPRNSVFVLSFSVLLAFFSLFSTQAARSFSSDSKPFPLKEVQGIFLTGQQESDFAKEFAFFKANIPKSAKVLNYCPNGDPFFPQSYWQPASRFFIFWSPFSDSSLFQKDILKADFITSCISFSELSGASQKIIKENFSRVGGRPDMISWNLKWVIYKKH
jgi:hypothetical protein